MSVASHSSAATPQPAITAAELHARLQQTNDLLVLDVRNEQDFQTEPIESFSLLQILHIPYVVFVEEPEQAIQQVPRGREIVVVCNRGRSSQFVVELLQTADIPALNLEGGITAWQACQLHE